ncbi:hypothetical protein IA57_06360 [Mangrovimonas yunxiaonensis]|uniref:DUF2480 family protein n=1 Tax=Mangrovimonas yunxiaonensis TaxID=1197477 RepID=A0A084TL62_9FLAO|nr:DUF2480 family protein [Mangrovimonas yunxiaonensis]KFB01448.1 hypothetical protein IA57_06360 [Mangrovimonas yunxiaonensis]GGH36608.1 hypothetical protein GCM10011364_04010 [Mangrovimonas yunxiaonensis]
MAKDIVNRIAKSPLVTLDLEDFYPQGQRMVLDIKDWLYEGLILKEKDFRAFVEQHNWHAYQDAYVALTCSADAIIPSWAYMLITTKLSPYANLVVVGDLVALETLIFQNIINTLPTEPYVGKPIIIKGCANKPIPETAYSLLISKLQPVAKSIMFGEACSTVPLFKQKK